MGENSFEGVFKVLKTVCDRLVLDVNRNNVDDLNNLLSTLPHESIQKFQPYICFPIEIQLLKTISSQQKQMLFGCLEKVLSLSYIDSASTLLRLNALLFQQVGVCKDKVSMSDVSEELKLGVVKCLSQIWLSTLSEVLYDVYNREYYPRLSPVIFMLVQLAKNEKYSELRVSALECLLFICNVHDSADISDVEMRHKARKVVMLMLPGIVSCCTSIAAESTSQNHKISVANLKVWSRVVCLVMEDREPPEEPICSSLAQLGTDTMAERVKLMQQQLRTADWLQETAGRLIAVTEALLRAQTHSHWQVRQQLALSAHLLLINCSKNLCASVGSLVCCLIILSEDDMCQVKDPAKLALSQFSREFESDTGQSLLELVESSFYNLLSRAPRIMQGTDERSQMSCLSLLVGFLRLQGSRLVTVLSSSSFQHRLLLTLLHISCLDVSHISLLEDCCIREVGNENAVNEPWKRLMFCDNAQKQNKLYEICKVLQRSVGPHIIHSLIDMLNSNTEHTKELILLTNNVLEGDSESMKEHMNLVKTVVDTYLQPKLWRVPFSVTNQEDPASSIPEAQSNIVQVALLAEGLGLFAICVGGKQFSVCLLRCLYPLLECAGSPLQPLASAGLAAVQNIAQACVGGGVTELVRANVDYLSHHITLRLKHSHQNPGVLSVLSVVIKHTTVQVLPCLQEIIEEVLAQSCNEFQEFNANGFLRVFLTFLVCLRGWQGKKPPQLNLESNIRKSTLESLLEFKKLKEISENLETEETLEEETQQELPEETMEEEGNKPKKVSPNIKLTVRVLETSLHFLSLKDEQRQILVLNILQEGVMLLADEEDELLPVVHKIWSPLVNRFQTSLTQPLVMHRAFNLLCSLGETAEDFIRHRSLKEVMPAVCKLLRDSASMSLLKDSGSAYRLTQLYKLQRALLTGLGTLALNLSMQERDIYNIAVSATPYLSNKQPVPLQDLCVQLFTELSSKHSDLIWLQLISTWSPKKQLIPPHPHFPTYQLESSTDEKSEFKKNVLTLLCSLES